jgi:hypothetical protein
MLKQIGVRAVLKVLRTFSRSFTPSRLITDRGVMRRGVKLHDVETSVSLKGVVFMFRGQRFFVDNHFHNFKKFADIHTSFFHQLILFPESLWINWLKHGLIVRVISFKVFQHFLKRMETYSRNLPAHHGSAFPDSRGSFGVKTLFPGYGIAMRGADGALAFIVKPVFGSLVSGRESKDNRPRWNFARHVNDKPMAGGHFYGLGNTHKENVA